jgi:hypothetical protein
MLITDLRAARADRAIEVDAIEFERGRVDGLQSSDWKSAEGDATAERHDAASDADTFTNDRSTDNIECRRLGGKVPVCIFGPFVIPA